MARLHDQLRYLSRLNGRRLSNMAIVYASFYWSRLTGRVSHPGMPVSMSIEPTTACNLGCPECPSGLRQFTRPTGNLREQHFRRWLDELAPTLTYLNFYFQGEPFIHPRILELIAYAHGKGIYTATSTNAHFLSDDVARRTVESGLDRLIISIDGTTQDVYEQYRVYGNLDQVLEGARRVIEWKKKLKSATPHVIFQFLVVRPNEHQIPDIQKLAREMGADEVRLKTAQVYNYKQGHPLIPLNPRYSRYRQTADGSWKVRNSLDNHCWRMWTGCVVTWDGRVTPCCFDKDARHALGDLSQESFRNIWNGPAYRQFRASLFRSRREIDICANCSEGTRVWA
ncbi:MAG: SPASM domain-containing protein [Flavobacteriales bacterium]